MKRESSLTNLWQTPIVVTNVADKITINIPKDDDFVDDRNAIELTNNKLNKGNNNLAQQPSPPSSAIQNVRVNCNYANEDNHDVNVNATPVMDNKVNDQSVVCDIPLDFPFDGVKNLSRQPSNAVKRKERKDICDVL